MCMCAQTKEGFIVTGPAMEEHEEETCMVGIGRIDYHESPKELAPHVDTNMQQWLTRHNLEGQITFSDPRYVQGGYVVIAWLLGGMGWARSPSWT